MYVYTYIHTYIHACIHNVPNGYIAVGWLLFLQEQIKVIIIYIITLSNFF
jgi:hypothetical protein